ncbi:hypothetical protein Pmar_PMAR022011 [Perkinsus marinus ATCC 50983]|uniref:Uncharacterized protein n=1 Tax=Perkinsus marinus (strain ATCC 50983 / TXsc) TaxID=423536 RepID=C5L619_PERM5|nr:hypothetical protein Pmar_PMAR022011 [Perkinsus marinus ATCC 50983]EER07804.1 hypothetical protein Pmar_PMAR022011 [Perkinsus marinus ATCC 50983]|eukprot:XP_002775988.1 hypothetical protein Pmar_PMAR022011 [Perkinsus marinus ATCC 50983]
MRNPALPWLLVAQALVITVAQDAGKYVYENRDFTMTYYVPGACYVAWPFPLAEKASSVYILQDEHSMGFDDWYNRIKFLLAHAHLVEPEDLNPLAEIQPGDLVTLTYHGKNSITTSFRKRELRFMRVMSTLPPGKYVYKGPLFSMTYDVNMDHEVAFSIYVPKPPHHRGDIPKPASISLGPYFLRSATGFTYYLDFGKPGPGGNHWRVELDRFLRNTGLMESDKVYPSDPSQEWDLTVLTSTSTITTNFQKKRIEFKRVAPR